MVIIPFLSLIDHGNKNVVLFKTAEECDVKQPIPHSQRQYLRDELAKEIFVLRKERGFATTHVLARTAEISVATIDALEQGRRTEEHITVLTLHKIATALSRTLVVKVNGEEKYFSAATSVEEIHQAEARIVFSREG